MDPLPFAAPLRAGRPGEFRSCGQSLTHLMSVLAITGIVTGGAPAMQNLVHEHRLVTHVNQLFGDLQLARSEAIKRGAQVTLCKSTDGASCSTASDWQNGWIVFIDANGSEAVDTGETVVRVGQALSASLTLRYGTSYRYVYYKPDGTAWPNATFTFCDPRGAANARAILVTQAGRARISDKSSNGGALTCS